MSKPLASKYLFRLKIFHSELAEVELVVMTQKHPNQTAKLIFIFLYRSHKVRISKHSDYLCKIKQTTLFLMLKVFGETQFGILRFCDDSKQVRFVLLLISTLSIGNL